MHTGGALGRVFVLLGLVVLVLGDSCYNHDRSRTDCRAHADESRHSSDGGGCRWCKVRNTDGGESQANACNSVAYLNAFEFEREYWECEDYVYDGKSESPDIVRDRASLAHTCMGRSSKEACAETGATDLRGEKCFWCIDPAVDGGHLCATNRYKAVMSFAFSGIDLKCQALSHPGDGNVGARTTKGKAPDLHKHSGSDKGDGSSEHDSNGDSGKDQGSHGSLGGVEAVDTKKRRIVRKKDSKDGKPPLPKQTDLSRSRPQKPTRDDAGGDSGVPGEKMDDMEPTGGGGGTHDSETLGGGRVEELTGTGGGTGGGRQHSKMGHMEMLTPASSDDHEEAAKPHVLTRVSDTDELHNAAPVHKLTPTDPAARVPPAPQPSVDSLAPGPAKTSIETKTVVKQTPYGPETHTITTTITRKIVDDKEPSSSPSVKETAESKPAALVGGSLPPLSLAPLPERRSETIAEPVSEPSTPKFGQMLHDAPTGRKDSLTLIGGGAGTGDGGASGDITPSAEVDSVPRDQRGTTMEPTTTGSHTSALQSESDIPQTIPAQTACAVEIGKPEFRTALLDDSRSAVVNHVFGFLDYIEDKVSEAVSQGNKEVDKDFFSEANRKLLQVSVATKSLKTTTSQNTELPFLKEWRRFFNEAARGRVGVEDVSFELEAHEMTYCQKSMKGTGSGGATPGGVDMRLDEKGQESAGFATLPLVAGNSMDDELTDEDRALLNDKSLDDGNFQLGDHIYMLAALGS